MTEDSTEIMVLNPSAVQVAMTERTNQISLQKEDSNSSIAYTQSADDLRGLITWFLPQFKLNDAKSEQELKQKFMRVSKLVGESRDLWLQAQDNIKAAAQFARNLRDKYNQHVNDKDNNLTWTEYHTIQDRNTLIEIIGKAQTLVNACKKIQNEVRDIVEDINNLIIGCGF